MSIALSYGLKPGSLILSVPFFCLEIVLAIWGHLCIHTISRFLCSSSVENAIGKLGISLNLWIDLRNILQY